MKKIIFLCLMLTTIWLSACLKNETFTDYCLSNDTDIKQSSYYNPTFTDLPIGFYKLYYKILRNDPSKPKPTIGSQISVKYTGKLLNGNVFDKNFRDTAFVFPVDTLANSSVITGLNEVVKHMQKGDSANVLMPSCLAFGSQDYYSVPGNSAVLFEGLVLSDIRTEDQLLEDYIKTRKFKTDSVTRTASGLKIVSKNPGTGDFPKDGQTVSISYKGYLVPNGITFDPAATSNNPKPKLSTYVFTVGNTNLIPGWIEAVKTIKVGGTAVWLMPSPLGYGSRGVSGSNVAVPIPGYSPLAFEVTLQSIK